ncbi:MAG: hypothetical protein R3B69_00385 [Candidatus Paceibacterota bacterium]
MLTLLLEHATATGNVLLDGENDFTLASGLSLAVGGTFTNRMGGAQTTWSDTTLYLFSGTDYTVSNKSITDTYGTLLVGAQHTATLLEFISSHYHGTYRRLSLLNGSC